MKKFLALLIILIPIASTIAQTALEEGNSCFELGDYTCAKVKYQNAIETTTGKDNQIAQIKLSRATSCDEWLTSANSAFDDENYHKAKENYQFVLNENPNDAYAQSQIEKCEKAIEANMTLSVSKLHITLSSFGGIERINIDTNAPTYSVSEYPTWCTIKTYTGFIDITYEENISKGIRAGAIKITAGKKEVIVKVTQPPKPKEEIKLSASNNYINIKPDEKMVFIDVKTNAKDYQVSDLPNWISIKNTYPTWFALDIDKNTSRESRSDRIKISAGNKEVWVKIEQNGVVNNKNQSSNTSTWQNSRYRPSTSRYRFFALGYEGGQIAMYGLRMEFGGRKFLGMFLNVRSTLISDEEILNNNGFLENKNEIVIGFNFRISRVVYFNLGGGFGYYSIPETSETLQQIDYYPVYGGMTFRLGRRVNFSVGASFLDIEQNIDTSNFDPEFTLGLTINVLK